MQLHEYFFQLVLILVSARILGELAEKFNLPTIIGELFAGLLIGPSLFNWVEPNAMTRLLAGIGILLLLFEVGFKTDVGRLGKTGIKPFIVAIGGVVIPFILGLLVAYPFFHLDLLVSLFIACTLTATSIDLPMRILKNLKKETKEETHIVLGAAVIDDILGIILLAMLYEFAAEGVISFINVIKIFFLVCLFIIIAPIIMKLFSNSIFYLNKKSQIPGMLPTCLLSLILFFAWLAHSIGAPELLGGFVIGIAFSQQFRLPLKGFKPIDLNYHHQVEEQMKPLIHLFSPLFFVNVGLLLNLREVEWNYPFIWTLSLCLLVVAIVGKLCSGFLLYQDSKWIKWAVGIAMVPRGEVGLIFAEVGKEIKILENSLYASLIFIIAITTLFARFALIHFYALKEKKDF